MITVLCIMGALTLSALIVWGVMAIRIHARQSAERAKEAFREDALNFILRFAAAKRKDGDNCTAAALESCGIHIQYHLTDDVTVEALQNETVRREMSAKKELAS